MMEFVSWDDEIPNWMEKIKMFQTTTTRYDQQKSIYPDLTTTVQPTASTVDATLPVGLTATSLSKPGTPQ